MEAKLNMRNRDFHIEKEIVRWNSNNSIPFLDMLEKMHEAGWITLEQSIKSSKLREIETTKMLHEYRRNMANHVPNPEEYFEMRAAFGEGSTVVNVITGKRISL